MKMKTIGFLAVLGVATVTMMHATDAEACGGAIWRESIQRTVKPSAPQLVARAEKQFDEGKTDAAVKSILEAYPQIAKRPQGKTIGKDAMANRALHLAALASLRTDGNASVVGARGPVSYIDYDYGKEVNVPAKLVAPKNADERQARKEWALGVLKNLHESNVDNVTWEQAYGEGLSLMPGHEAEALQVLSKLSDKDLLGSPQAYAALAKLRFQNGLTKKSVEAMNRCRAMSNNASYCGPVAVGNPV